LPRKFHLLLITKVSGGDKALLSYGFRYFWALVAFGLGLSFMISIYRKPARIALLDFVRASEIWNGVSALHPLLFAGIAGLCMAICNLRRLNLLQECRITPPFLGFDRSISFSAISRCEEEIANRLECPFHQIPMSLPAEGLIVAAGVYFILIRQWGIYPIDGTAFGWFFYALCFIVYLLFFQSLLRFSSLWWCLHKFLRALYWHPTRTSYEELRKRTVPERPEAQHVTLFEPRPSLTAIEGCLGFGRNLLQYANRVVPVPGSLSARLIEVAPLLRSYVCDAELKLSSALQSEADANPFNTIRARREAQADMARLSAVVVRIFEPLWRAISQPSMAAPDDEEKDLLDFGNLFVAARVVDLLRQIFPQLLNLACFSMVGALAMTLAVSGYPFPGHDTMLWFSWLVLLSVIGMILVVFIQMNRDRVLSMLTGTTPGRLNWNSSFVLQVVVFGVIPVLTLMGAQFPHTLSGLFSWMGGVFGGNK
jgi:hypothetical protein